MSKAEPGPPNDAETLQATQNIPELESTSVDDALPEISGTSHIPSSQPPVVVEAMPPTLTPAPQLTPSTTPTKPAPVKGLTLQGPQVQPSPAITATIPAKQTVKTPVAPQPSPKPVPTTMNAASLAHALPAKPISQTADGGKKKMTFVVPKGHQLVMRTGPDGKSQFVTVPKSQLTQAQQKSQLLTQVTTPSQPQSQVVSPPQPQTQTVIKTQTPLLKSPPKPARTLSPTQFLQKSEPEAHYVSGSTPMYPSTSAVTSDMTSMTPGMTSVTPGMTSEELALAEAEHAAEMLLGMSGALVPQAPPPVQQQPIISQQPPPELVAQQPITQPSATAVPMQTNPDGTQQYLLIVDDPKNPGQQQQLIINYTPDKPGGQLDLQQILDALASGGQF